MSPYKRSFFCPALSPLSATATPQQTGHTQSATRERQINKSRRFRDRRRAVVLTRATKFILSSGMLRFASEAFSSHSRESKSFGEIKKRARALHKRELHARAKQKRGRYISLGQGALWKSVIEVRVTFGGIIR